MGWISRAKSTCPAGAVTGVGACALSNAATELAANKARTIEGTRGIGTPSIKLFDVHQDTRNRQEIQPRTRRFFVPRPHDCAAGAGAERGVAGPRSRSGT